MLNIVYAQNSSNNVGQQIWLDFNPQRELDKNYTLYCEIRLRTTAPHSWTSLGLTAAVRYAPDPLFYFLNRSQQEIHGGITFLNTFNENAENQIELRPFQGYKIRWPHFQFVKFTHFLRLEERFLFSSGESNFELRGRYKIEAIVHNTKHLVDFADGLYFPISVEFLINLYSTIQFNDGLRVTPGLGYSSESELWKAEFNFSYQYTHKADEIDIGAYTKNTIIYRLRFYMAI